MSIPGLGQIPAEQQPTTSTKRRVILRPGWEWRFDVGFAAPGVTVKVESGTCERDGIELAPRHGYTLRGVRSRLLTWQGCELEIEGRCEEETAGPATAGAAAGNGVPGVADGLVNLHASLDEMRRASSRSGAEGPRVAVVGPRGSGKTSAVRTLASYAVRRSHQPLVANLDPGEGMLTLPGTLSAAVLATVMDPEAPDAWGSTPTSGPSATPVKLPIVHYLGRKDAEGDREAYRELVARLAGSVSHRLSAADDAVVKASGLLVDCPAGLEGELLAHIVDEMSVNIILVIGPPDVEGDLARRFAGEKTSLGEPIQVVRIDASPGVWARDEAFMQRAREAAIKEYFFGDARRTLSPQIQHMGFDGVVIYKIDDSRLAREEPSTLMQHWTLAIMHASTRDPPEVVRAASVMGYVYVSDVDEERRKIKLLSPVSGRLGDRPMVWGSWPEPHMNLLG